VQELRQAGCGLFLFPPRNAHQNNIIVDACGMIMICVFFHALLSKLERFLMAEKLPWLHKFIKKALILYEEYNDGQFSSSSTKLIQSATQVARFG
jgi:hypothetical protein